MPPPLMPAPQIVHVEDFAIGARTNTLCVVRIAGGLAGQWHCFCGEALALPLTHLTMDEALRHAKQDLHRHYREAHAVESQP